MVSITVKGLASDSQILIGESIDNLSKYIPGRGIFIITDSNIHRIYSSRFPQARVFVTEPGEGAKTIESSAQIYRWLLEQGADRSSFIVGIGGGVVCDLAGYIASTFMRGLGFGFVATSLLAQVDASVGGKNGINLDGYKNTIGTFNQPKFVICDTSMLKTLPREEYCNGLAEIVKHALICDAPKFNFIEANIHKILSLNSEAMEYLVTRSVQIKADIVQADERERGERRKLNLGHTWGHAIEKVDKIPHGQAVSIGLALASELSVRKGLMTPAQRERLLLLLTQLGLPTTTQTSLDILFQALIKDKKKEQDILYFVLMEGIGSTVVAPIPVTELNPNQSLW